MTNRLAHALRAFLLASGVLLATAVVGSGGLSFGRPLVAQSAPAAPDVPALITGLAILGDSTQDEYQADSARGGPYVGVTMNWVELLAAKRDLNRGAMGHLSRAAPQRLCI